MTPLLHKLAQECQITVPNGVDSLPLTRIFLFNRSFNMNIVQPKIKIQRLRDTNPEVCEVLDLLIREFVISMRKIPIENNPYGQLALNLGLEGNIEAVEELIDAGLLKLCYTEETDNYFMLIWNGADYVAIGDDTL